RRSSAPTTTRSCCASAGRRPRGSSTPSSGADPAPDRIACRRGGEELLEVRYVGKSAWGDLPAPVLPDDAATRAWVEEQLSGGGGGTSVDIGSAWRGQWAAATDYVIGD